MPHLVILYTGNLDAEADISALSRTLADTMLTVKDDDGKQVFPTGGTRVLAYPAPHFAVADGGAAGRAAGGTGDYAFVYLNVRMARGRPDTVKQRVGETLMAATRTWFEPIFGRRHIGITFQVDEGHEVFDAKHSNIHPLFAK